MWSTVLGCVLCGKLSRRNFVTASSRSLEISEPLECEYDTPATVYNMRRGSLTGGRAHICGRAVFQSGRAIFKKCSNLSFFKKIIK